MVIERDHFESRDRSFRIKRDHFESREIISNQERESFQIERVERIKKLSMCNTVV